MAFQNSRWLIQRTIDGPKGPIEDQEIVVTATSVTATSGKVFTAQYNGGFNKSVFTGEIWTRETEVLSLKQHDHKTKYVAFHVAHRKDNEYEGRWLDNAGNKGNFRLTRRP